MDWNRVEGNWKQVKGKVKEQWGKLTDDDLDVIEGRRDQLEGDSLDPRELVLYQPDQYAELPYVPYEDAATIGWVVTRSLASGALVHVPAVAVLMGYTPSHNMTDPVPASMGDNPGVATGVASGTVMMNTRPVTAAFTVLVNGAPLTRLTTVNIQNSTNCPGGRIAPSQVQVIVLAP